MDFPDNDPRGLIMGQEPPAGVIIGRPINPKAPHPRKNRVLTLDTAFWRVVDMCDFLFDGAHDYWAAQRAEDADLAAVVGAIIPGPNSVLFHNIQMDVAERRGWSWAWWYAAAYFTPQNIERWLRRGLLSQDAPRETFTAVDGAGNLTRIVRRVPGGSPP